MRLIQNSGEKFKKYSLWYTFFKKEEQHVIVGGGDGEQ